MEVKYKKVSFWRSKARFLFQILLAIGFTIQSVKFVEMYLQYPSSVELEVVQPSEVELPAFTVCNINEIRASSYCREYPQFCGTPETDSTFCTRFAEYCNLVNVSKEVPLRDKDSFRHLTRYQQQILGHQYSTLVSSCTIETDDEERNCSSTPILVPALSFSYEIPFNCWMIYSLHNKPHEAPQKVPVSTKIHLILNLEVSEYHPSHLSRGAQLSIHSPFHVPSPVGEGLFLNMGTVYRIYIRLSEKNLLPQPFKSKCTDYEKMWKLNGGQGPVTEKMCKEKCKLEKSLDIYNCAERRIDYPHNETICLEPIPNFAKETRFECAKSCTSPCKMRRYEVQVQEADSEGNRKACVTASDLSCATLVHIYFENLEITTFTYMPRFEPIGILSFIGGYVGLWLGISFLTVYDFLETRLFHLVSVIKKKTRMRKVSADPRTDRYSVRTNSNLASKDSKPKHSLKIPSKLLSPVYVTNHRGQKLQHT